MTPLLVRAARAMLGLSQQELAQISLISWTSINSYERERARLSTRTQRAIITALEERGVTFLANDREGLGVRLRKPNNAKPSNDNRGA